MNTRRALKRIPLALAAVLVSHPALALDAPVAADAHVSASLPTTHFGNLPNLNVGGGSTGLLRFDLGTLPSATTAAKLVKATLVLYVNRVGIAGTIEAQTINSAWTEAAVTQGSAPVTSGASSVPDRAGGASRGDRACWPDRRYRVGWRAGAARNPGLPGCSRYSRPGRSAGHQWLDGAGGANRPDWLYRVGWISRAARTPRHPG